MLSLSLPSPAQGVWHLGPLPLRAYALCIIAGIVVAVWLAERRLVSRGGRPGAVSDIAIWAVPFGIVGGRIYHVITDPELYFAAGKNPWDAFAVWHGGLGIWGAILLGGIGAWIGARRSNIQFAELAWALAPAIPLAQGIGRWGNWFNQELFGKPTDLPWALRIAPQHRPSGYENLTTFHPTFLYESLWDFGLAGLIIWAGYRFRLNGLHLFALYLMGYTLGRGWIEYLRIDTVNQVLGLRLNVWTSIIVFIAAAAYLVLTRKRNEARHEIAGQESSRSK